MIRTDSRPPRDAANGWTRAASAVALGLVVAGLLAVAPVARAQDDLAAADIEDLVEMSLEQLSDLEVMSVSRRAEPLSHAAASIFVITAEDIRRSGAITIAEALRIAPNLQVAQADASQWAISARGFNSTIANNMLVLIDGRTVYSPLYSGVFWDAQSVPLEDIERIEVISGPGGTLWGTNAVNGVINILTRSARDTQGALLTGAYGTTQRLGQARYGDTLGKNFDWRIHGRWVELEESENAAGQGVGDFAQRWLGGFRVDRGDSNSSLTLLGSVYRSDIDQVATERVVENKHLLVAWAKRLGPGRDLRVQAYYDRNDREQPPTIRDALDTYDIEFQHPLAPMGGHRVLWGAGYRRHVDDLDNLGPTLAFDPADRTLDYIQAFVEDDIRVSDDLDVVAGVRFERNDYTEWEVLPTLRLAYRPTESRLLWTALSRAVRAPARIDRELFIPAAPPFTALAGGPNFVSEIAQVAELGYKAQPSAYVSYSLSGYVQWNDRLRSLEPLPAGPTFENGLEGVTTGLEAWGRWRARPWWRLDVGWVEMRRTVDRDPESNDATNWAQLGNDPHRWGTLHSAMDVLGRHELDLWLRYVGALPQPDVPDYLAFDMRLGFRLPRGVELSLVGKNLFDDGHAEWGAAPGRVEFERSVLAMLRWRFWRT